MVWSTSESLRGPEARRHRDDHRPDSYGILTHQPGGVVVGAECSAGLMAGGRRADPSPDLSPEAGVGGGEEEVAELDGVDDVGVEQHERATSRWRAHGPVRSGVEEAEFLSILGEFVQCTAAPFEVGA